MRAFSVAAAREEARRDLFVLVAYRGKHEAVQNIAKDLAKQIGQ